MRDVQLISSDVKKSLKLLYQTRR